MRDTGIMHYTGYKFMTLLSTYLDLINKATVLFIVTKHFDLKTIYCSWIFI